MADFMMIYRDSGKDLSAEEMQAHLQNCLDWFKGLISEGAIKDPGFPLRAGAVVTGRGRAIHDGPFAEIKDVISGITLVTAADMAAAIEIAKTCPVAEVGGSIEVRQIGSLPVEWGF